MSILINLNCNNQIIFRLIHWLETFSCSPSMSKPILKRQWRLRRMDWKRIQRHKKGVLTARSIHHGIHFFGWQYRKIFSSRNRVSTNDMTVLQPKNNKHSYTQYTLVRTIHTRTHNAHSYTQYTFVHTIHTRTHNTHSYTQYTFVHTIHTRTHNAHSYTQYTLVHTIHTRTHNTHSYTQYTLVHIMHTRTHNTHSYTQYTFVHTIHTRTHNAHSYTQYTLVHTIHTRTYKHHYDNLWLQYNNYFLYGADW